VKLSNLKWKGHDLELFAEGVVAPRRITATASGHDPDYDLELEIELERGRYVLRTMTCRARKRGAITSEGVNGIPVPKIVRIILGRALGTFSPPGPAPSDRGPTEEALRRVAWVYQTAHLMGLPPTESVSQDLDLPRSTAGRWVSMARQRGFLGKAEPRKAGERARRKR
jgi:hypothetical protein